MKAHVSSRAIGIIVALAVALAFAAMACGGKVNYGACGDGGIGDCRKSILTATKVNCACNVDVPTVTAFLQAKLAQRFPDGGAPDVDVPEVINVPACLPNDINALVTDADLGDVDLNAYGVEVSDWCDRVREGANLVVTLFADACGAGTPIVGLFKTCPPARNAAGNFDVIMNPSCTGCFADAAVPCTKFDSEAGTGTCRNPIFSDGTIDLTLCNCNTVISCGCGNFPNKACPNGGNPICRPLPTSPDPPASTYGLVPATISGQSILSVDPSQSSFTLTVALQGEGGGVTTKAVGVRGDVHTWGLVRDDGTAGVGIDLGLFIDDIHFSVGNTNINLTNIVASGGTEGGKVALDAAGKGSLNPMALAFNLDFVQEGKVPTTLPITNGNNVPLKIDYANKTFEVPSLPFNNQLGVSGNFVLKGRIINQPPVARTGPDQVLECTSPQGAPATLDGLTTTDPDNNFVQSAWFDGIAFDAPVLAKDFKTIVTSPLGTRLYTFGVSDTAAQASQATTSVTVRDTTPPTLTVSAVPDCLWAPNHKVVLYELGKQLPFIVKDTCDPNPTVELAGVVSNQPDVGGGQGNFTPDFLSGKMNVCVRSERQGTVMWDREYTISVVATDASNNKTKKNVVIRVPHDQSGATNCPTIDPDRYVDQTDPRCTK